MIVYRINDNPRVYFAKGSGSLGSKTIISRIIIKNQAIICDRGRGRCVISPSYVQKSRYSVGTQCLHCDCAESRIYSNTH